MKISKDLLESLEKLGDHHPLAPTLFMEKMPSVETLRPLIPTIIGTDEIRFIYKKQNLFNYWFPKHRIAFMLFINHFFRIRTDPHFLIAEAVQCHRITGSEHKKRRHIQLLDMVEEARQHGCDSIAVAAYDFLEWWNKWRRCKTFPSRDHLGRPTVFPTEQGAWGTQLSAQVFSCKSSAKSYARDHFQMRYEALLEDE